MAKSKHFGPLAAAAGALVAVAVLVLVLVVNPQPAKAAFPGQNGKIAFATDRHATTNNPFNYEIYTINSTGTGSARRTDNPAWDREPAYSPDGTKIAFQSDRSGNEDIWIINSTGTPNPKQITSDAARDLDPNWHPDGNRIIFASNRGGGNEQIWEVDSTGTEGNPQKISAASARHLEPAYRSDGKSIVFQFDGGVNPVPNWNIWTMRPGSPGSYERVTDDPRDDEEPAYSPDGSRVAFASERFDPPPSPPVNVDLLSATPTGVEDDLVEILNRQLFSLAVDEKPAFSPDGSKIVFDSNRSGNYDIWIVNCSFQEPTLTRITNNPATDYAPDWQRLP
jgi:Tol biopolymer transport system component